MEGQELELHYHLAGGLHSMNAFTRNRCEAEAIAAFQHIASQLGIGVVVETIADSEGGLKSLYKFVFTKESAPAWGMAALAALVAILVAYWTAPSKELETLQKEHLQLKIEKLKKELGKSDVVAAEVVAAGVAVFQSDMKAVTRRSNFYKALAPYGRVTAVGTSASPSEYRISDRERIVERADFSKFIVKSDKLPDLIVDNALIEIVAPVIKEGKVRWKGIYLKEGISFAMTDKFYKKQVLNRQVSFQNGDAIRCILHIHRRINEIGDPVTTGWSVSTVLAKIEGSEVVVTRKGREKRFYDEHADAQPDLFAKLEVDVPENPGSPKRH